MIQGDQGKQSNFRILFYLITDNLVDFKFTTLIASICMFLLGDGPIKGFAVTLSIGIFSTIFSNIVFTRVLTRHLINPESLSGGKNEV